jgi:hypothetical protein
VSTRAEQDAVQAQLDAAVDELVQATAELREETATVRRGRGRPPVGPLLTGVRISQEVEEEIDELAAAAGVKRAELVRELLDEALTARRRKAAKHR